MWQKYGQFCTAYAGMLAVHEAGINSSWFNTSKAKTIGRKLMKMSRSNTLKTKFMCFTCNQK